MPLERGASVASDGAVRFSVWAPHAARVSVCVLTGGRTGEWPLERDARGVFSGRVEGVAPGADYVYRLDGAGERPDPVSRHQPHGVQGPSRVVDPGAFRWTDAGWSVPALADLVLYELHVGTFTADGTFDAVIPDLARLRPLGIGAIELMPVGEFPGGRNWGYDGVHPYAPQSTYGGPEALRRLVDAAHRLGLGVFLDVVYNHVGPEGNHLADFGPYFTDRYRTPWGVAVNFDGPDSDEVRRWVVDNAVYWISEFHLDGLRLDAVHAIFDLSARHLLAELAAAVHAEGVRTGRRAHVIAESDLNDPRIVRPPERGGHGLDAQWSDDFHHAVHAAVTGERDGYYADFADGVAPVAKGLTDRFVYDGRWSAYRRRRQGAPAGDVPADRFVVFVQNHDQVGNRARGERLSTLVPFPRFKLAAAVVLLSPYVPLLFMGEEYGETNPFFYFVSHRDPALLEAVRRGRREEFADFAWHDEVPDPASEETFRRSRLDRTRMQAPLVRLYEDCLSLRRTEPSLRPGDAAVHVASDAAAGWLRLDLVAPAAPPIVSLFNFADAQPVPLPAGARDEWTFVLSTDDARYGGAADGPPSFDGGAVVAPAWSAVVWRARGG